MTNELLETDLVPQSEPLSSESQAEATKKEINQEINQNNCQGYQVNPLTKLHLCNACEYHRYRNEVKPWLKKEEK